MFESEGELTDSLQSKAILENETIDKTLNFDTIVSFNPQKDQNVHRMQIWWTIEADRAELHEVKAS